MGIYDRDYIRREEPGIHLGGIQTVTTKIVLITVAVYIVQLITNRPTVEYRFGWFNDFFALHADALKRPWMLFELLTYGFMHSVTDLKHVLFNMLIFWFLGRELERRYGRGEFVSFYLTAIIVAGFAASVVYLLRGQVAMSWGASGGVTAVMVLFAFNWPRREVLLFFVIPLPIWVVALGAIVFDMYGAVNQIGHVGYEAHLGGAAFALLYYKFGWRLGRFLPTSLSIPKLKRGPKLRIHSPNEETGNDAEDQVDDILRKIQREGQDSLTHRERRILKNASRKFQRRRPK